MDQVEDGRTDRLVEVHDREDLDGTSGSSPTRSIVKLSADPLFIDKLYYLVGLSLNPPEAVVLCVDELSRTEARWRPYGPYVSSARSPNRSNAHLDVHIGGSEHRRSNT